MSAGGDGTGDRDALAGLHARVQELEAELEARELELQRANARAAAQEMAGNMGLWELDPTTGRGSWSPKLFEFYYMRPSEEPPALEDSAFLVHPDDQPAITANMEKLLVDGVAPPIIFRTHPDLGPVRYLRAGVSRVDDRGGRVVGIYGAVTDVSQQMRVEGELAASTRKLEALFLHSPYTVIGIERDRTISFINRVAAGTAIEDVIGRRYDGHMKAEDRARIDAALQRLFAEGTDFHTEVEDVVGRRWESRFVPLMSEDRGVVESALLFTVDVTEQRRLEAQMLNAQKLESLGVLAGGIAHDFNNLLVGVLGNAELALLNEDLEAEARECLEEIVESARRAADLCRQMLAYSGRGRFVVEVIELPNVVRELTHLLEASISKKASLRCVFDPETAAVRADVTQVRQVVMNLITNASDALGDADGTITVTTSTVGGDSADLAETYLHEELGEGRYTFIEVSDTGCGMDEETKSRMFEPFYTSKPAGRGLGLSAVLGIVRSHRGAITVSSERDRGTTVKIWLRATGDAQASTDRAEDDDTCRGEGTVLVVDDEPVVRSLAGRLLQKLGFDVLMARDGVEALSIYRERGAEITLVLLDMSMPRMDGKSTFRELRKLNPRVPVLLSSGYDEKEATSEMAGHDLAGFVQKPYTARALTVAARALLDG